MPRQKKPSPMPAAPSIPPSKTTHLFSARKPVDRNAITHERIAADLEEFRKAGGKIEVLGVTRSLKRIGPDADDAPPTPPASPAKPRR